MRVRLYKTICDRCGVSITQETPAEVPKWNAIKFENTGAELDICEYCNNSLLEYLNEEGADNMQKACIKDYKEVI